MAPPVSIRRRPKRSDVALEIEKVGARRDPTSSRETTCAARGSVDWSRTGRLDRRTDSSSQSGSPSDALQIDSIKISPDPPKPGQDLTIVASGRAQSKIDVRLISPPPCVKHERRRRRELTNRARFSQFGTYADVTVKLGLIKLLTKTFDVCNEL